MNYQEARSSIFDGDIVEVLTAHGLFGYATKLFTGRYTHTAMALWLDGGLWMVELNGGRNHAIPMSQLEDVDFDVYDPPPGLVRSELREAALESIRVRQNYGYLAAVATGINEYFGLGLTIGWTQVLDCTGYIIKILEAKGWPRHSFITSPTLLSKELVLKLEVRHA